MVGRALALALAAAATIAPGAAASAPAPSRPATPLPAAVPPDLQALEQKMLALKPTSERFSASIEIAEKPKVKGPVGGFNHIFGHASSVLVPLIARGRRSQPRPATGGELHGQLPRDSRSAGG